MDDTDRQLLILFQKEIPLKPRPFEVLGKSIGIHGADVMLRLNRLQEDGLVGRLAGLFDPEKIGYRICFVAMKTAEDRAQQAAYYLSGHPGVTMCVRCSGSFNFWFSMVLPAAEPLEFHLNRLKELSEAQKLLMLKTEKIYKPAGKSSGGEIQENQAFEDSKKCWEDLTPLERKLIRFVQDDFPLADNPYGKIAAEIGSSEELVLKQLQFFKKKGQLRKISTASLPRVRKAGGVFLLWNLPEEKTEEAGQTLAGFEEVVFCAKRTPYQELPYNVHVSAEGVPEGKVPELIERMERKIGMWPRQVFLKEKEEKRARMKYFSKDIEDWRLQHEDHAVSPQGF